MDRTTKHTPGCFFSNVPQKCTDGRNIANLISKYEGVFVTLKVNYVIVKQWFAVVRDTRNLNASNLMRELKELNYFNYEIEMEDVNKIADSMMEKLKNVINILVCNLHSTKL